MRQDRLYMDDLVLSWRLIDKNIYWCDKFRDWSVQSSVPFLLQDPEAKQVADALADLDFELDSQDADSDESNEKELRGTIAYTCMVYMALCSIMWHLQATCVQS